MLANGSDLTTVDNLTIEDAKDLYVTLQGGLWGPYGQAHQTYAIYCSQHMQKEVAVAVASGKKYRPTQPTAFHEMFPVVDDFHTLGAGVVKRAMDKKNSLAKKALAILPIEGAPKWLREGL